MTQQVPPTSAAVQQAIQRDLEAPGFPFQQRPPQHSPQLGSERASPPGREDREDDDLYDR